MSLFPEAGFVPMPAPVTSSTGPYRFRLSETSRCFDGHFDGAPILPGVAHVALALEACAKAAGKPRVLIGLRNLRFDRPLGPDDRVEVVLTTGPDPSSIQFEISTQGERASAGLLVFRSGGDATPE